MNRMKLGRGKTTYAFIKQLSKTKIKIKRTKLAQTKLK